MNERIRELAHQAELPVIDGMWDYNDREILRREDGEWRVATPAEIISLLFACEKGREKFAELIIRESMDLLEDFTNDIYLGGIEYVVVGASETLQEHFGIEE